METQNTVPREHEISRSLMVPDGLSEVVQARRQRGRYLAAAGVDLIRFLARARPDPSRFGHLMAPMLLVASTGAILAYAVLLRTFGDTQVSLAALLGIFGAATLSSIAGFAFSAIAGALLLHLMKSPVQIVEIMMLCSIAIQSLSVWVLRQGIDWRSLATFLVGGLLGVVPGVFLLLHMQPTAYRRTIGVLLILYAGYMMLRRPVVLRWRSAAADTAIGFLSGMTGGLIGFPGAFVTIWCGTKAWDKAHQRSIYQPFILVMQVIALIAIPIIQPSRAHAALPGTMAWMAPCAYVPAALLGTICGLRLYRTLNDRQFGIAVNAMLMVSGCGLAV